MRELKRGKHHCIYLQRDWNKNSYTEDDFEFNILFERNTLEEISRLEEYFLNYSSEDLYNVSNVSTGGDLISNHPNKDVVRKNMSRAVCKR